MPALSEPSSPGSSPVLLGEDGVNVPEDGANVPSPVAPSFEPVPLCGDGVAAYAPIPLCGDGVAVGTVAGGAYCSLPATMAEDTLMLVLLISIGHAALKSLLVANDVFRRACTTNTSSAKCLYANCTNGLPGD